MIIPEETQNLLYMCSAANCSDSVCVVMSLHKCDLLESQCLIQVHKSQHPYDIIMHVFFASFPWILYLYIF